MSDFDTFLPAFDCAAIGVSLCSLSVYLVLYQNRVFRKELAHSTQTGRNFANMFLWVQKHGEKPDAPTVTLAVQTLRNTILVAVFIGGSSLTAAVSALDILTRPVVTPQLLTRQLLIASLLFLSFLNWTQVLRYAHHVGFFVGTLEMHVSHARETQLREATTKAAKEDADADATKVSPPSGDDSSTVLNATRPSETALVVESVSRSGSGSGLGSVYDTEAAADLQDMAFKMTNHFSWGFRFMYFTIPYWMYAGGPIALVASSGITLALLVYFDFPLMPKRKSE